MSIGVAWLGDRAEPERLLADTVAALGREFRVTVERVRMDGRPEGTLDPVRRQHSSRMVLAWLARHGTSGTRRLLGVTDVDLFIPVLTFVFGEAQLGGSAAVVSTARLNDGAPASVVSERLAKEAVHEVGHTFGLVHCAAPACVMARSAALASVDRKMARLCADCRARYWAIEEQSRVTAHPAHPDR